MLQVKTVGATSPVAQGVGLQEAFPDVDPGMIPLGSRVLVQLRQAKERTRGGIILSDESKASEKWNTQVAIVRALGPVAFRSRKDLETWPEGEWVKEGDFVRVPKYNGDRFEVPFGEPNSTAVQLALFVIFNDLEIIGKVTGDPLDVIAFV